MEEPRDRFSMKTPWSYSVYVFWLHQAKETISHENSTQTTEQRILKYTETAKHEVPTIQHILDKLNKTTAHNYT